jgi:hypothetical protein
VKIETNYKYKIMLNKANTAMEYVQNEFSKELSSVFLKHKKRIEADKHGIHILDDETGSSFLIAKATSGSEDYRDTLIQVCGGDVKCLENIADEAYTKK